jgi:serine protease Do
MVMSTRRFRLPLLLAVLGILAYAGWSLHREPAPKVWMTTPADQEALYSMQERVQSATRRVMPAVVAVKYAGADTSSSKTPWGTERYASGVIITIDGLILSQFHVSHRLEWRPGEPYRSRQPGERTMVILSDGRKIEAELLGADATFDLSLLRLLEPGPYPHAALDPSSNVGIGDWVLKLGHPTGYRRDRPPVVRLGRVLFQNKDIFVTDCLTTGGDSGGPFFDLEGRLLGIICSSSVPAKLEDTLTNPGREPVRIGPSSSTTGRFIQQRLNGMLRCEIAAFDQQAAKRVWESYRRVDDKEILPRDQWTQGERTAKAFQDSIRIPRHGVAAILDEAGRQAALGTVVDSDGWVMTSAGTLPAEPRCRLSDAQVLVAQVVGVNPAFNLALLKVQGTNLPPIRCAEKPPPVAGTILAAVGMSETPLAIGVVSVPRRDMPGPFPTRVARRGAERPGVFGKPTAQGYLVDSVQLGRAYEAGIRIGDVILTIAGRDIRDEEDLLKCVSGRVEGERVRVGLLRGGQRQDLILSLIAEPKPLAGFPTLFEHDMPLTPDVCGGPVVDLAGEVVGITLYCGEYGCMAIPSDCVKPLLLVLKSSGLSDNWIKPPPASPIGHEPSGVNDEPRKTTNQRTR